MLETVAHGATGTAIGQIVVYGIAAAAGALFVAIGKAGVNLYKNFQKSRKETDADQQTLSEFLFGVARDHRTGTPAREGWTTKVDRMLGQLSTGQAQTMQLLREVVYELKPNGGSNLRGAVDRVDESIKKNGEGSNESGD